METIAVDHGDQVLWPDHCVQGSSGAKFHPDLAIPHAQLILRKGYNREIDSYSAFFENDHHMATGLPGYLRERGLTRILLVGLAFDYCARFSALDAVNEGFAAFVVQDACRGIGLNGSVQETRKSLAGHKVRCIDAADIG
jgi:nicotinamidase/pyrazinamidase